MKINRTKYLATILLFAIVVSCSPKKTPKVLVFSKTAGYRHGSIETGVEAIKKLGIENNFEVDHTEGSQDFTEEKLKKYAAVLWLSTTEDVLNNIEQAEFERYIQAGGNYVGIHAAADTEYDWAWYGKLVGGYFNGHPNNPNVRSAELELLDSTHISTKMLPQRWMRTDEWYNYKNLNPKVHPLLRIDETTYEGGTNGENHPMAWYHEFDGGRAWYTAGGHTEESYAEDLFLQHILGGIKYAIGDNEKLDYSKATTLAIPHENRFKMTELGSGFSEPMEMEVLDDGTVLFIERKGAIKKYDPITNEISVVDTIIVFSKFEDGLLGIAVDPNFNENNWIYLMYSPVGNVAKQHVSRFTYKNGQLNLSSEKVILEIPIQRDTCCHSAGSLEFDVDGNLYISTGDDTNPFESAGFAPIDERTNRQYFDAQRTSANANDLRGKILRIKPLVNGTYAIPEGNLFPKGTPDTKPEIYVMGCRNPFRISIDNHTKYLYWGDVGPDAGNDRKKRGARGHDEVNQARQAGNFGWPYFVGDNKAYYDFDFQTNKSNEQFDPNKPINNSPNNSGIQELPPAQKAFVWYPYAKSEEFPLTKKGGRNAMAGPVYYYDDYANSNNRFPKYYDKKLFIYDWMRGWINVVTMSENGDYQSMEAFMPSEKFHNPVDMIMHKKNGALYVLEYGTKWFSKNDDARLIRIDYISGNRQPNVQLAADVVAGAAPLTVNFSSEGTEDFDRQDLFYEWTFTGNKVQSMEENPVFTFEKNGIYQVELKVTDEAGGVSKATKQIAVGNNLPEVTWKIEGNSTFYFDNQPITYRVNVSDKEDGTIGKGIDESEVTVSIDYLEEGFDKTEIAQGHQTAKNSTKYNSGKKLITESDCKACHQINEKSAGPAYKDIAKKYAKDGEKAVKKLASRVISGGSGVWGNTAMSAHPQLSTKEAEKMVRYILSLNSAVKSYKPSGTYLPTAHLDKKTTGNYIMMASYEDKGANQLPSTIAQKTWVFRNTKVEFETADEYSDLIAPYEVPDDEKKKAGMSKDADVMIMTGMTNDKHLMFSQIDLSGIQTLLVSVYANSAYFVGGTLEVRLGKPDGDLIGQTKIPLDIMDTIRIPIKATNGEQELYFVFKNTAQPDAGICAVDYVVFSKK